MARIVMASYMVRYPVGGYQSWMLQWLLGFARLGHDVYFVEKAGWYDSCYDPSTGMNTNDATYGLRSTAALMRQFGLEDRWCFVDYSGVYHGLSKARIEDVFRGTDIFVDHMRDCEWREEAAHAGVRAVIDGEPAFFQMQIEQQQGSARSRLPFDYYYTVGLNLGTAQCTAPTAGLEWRPILDPVLPDLFEAGSPPPAAPWTTVMSWQAHEPVTYKGVVYGQKDVEFEHFMDLPTRTTVRLELAIAGKDTPRSRLMSAGWELRDSHAVTTSFDAWRGYIGGSAGEFSVAKSVFVRTNSGFFSDRSAAYLASGRPVVLQETGFSQHLPCGEGLFAVRSVEEAADAIREVTGNYEWHSRKARELAHEHLHAEKVLAKFVNEVGVRK